MAKAGKVSSALFPNPFEKRDERPCGILPERQYFLIVCEGKKTETYYFESIKRILPHHMVNQITITGTGKNTLSLVNHAQNEVDKRRKSGSPPYDSIWVVFDRDSFNADDFDNAIFSIEKKSSKTERWMAAWSNEAFEIWFIMHFRDQTGAPLSRKVYKKVLTKEIGRSYKKNAKDMFAILKPHLKEAIKRAKTSLRLQSDKPFHDKNPATTVHILVEELLKYIGG